MVSWAGRVISSSTTHLRGDCWLGGVGAGEGEVDGPHPDREARPAQARGVALGEGQRGHQRAQHQRLQQHRHAVAAPVHQHPVEQPT